MLKVISLFFILFLFNESTVYDVRKFNPKKYDNDKTIRDLIEQKISLFNKVKPYYSMKVVSKKTIGSISEKIIYSKMDDYTSLYLLNIKNNRLTSFLEISRLSEDEEWQLHSISKISNDTIYKVVLNKTGNHWEENAVLNTKKISTLYHNKNGVIKLLSSDTLKYKETVPEEL